MLAADAASTCPPGGRTCALKAAGAARALCGLDALRLPSWAPLPARHTAFVGASRRKPPQSAGSVLRTVARFELDARHQPGWLPALRFVSGGLRSLALPAPRPHASAWARPRRLDRACTRSAPAALRRPAGAGAPSRQHRRLPMLTAVLRRRLLPPIPRLPASGKERVALCRQRCPASTAKHRSRRASVGVKPLQGRALRVAALFQFVPP